MAVFNMTGKAGSGGGGIDTSDATAYPEHLLSGYTAYARGSKITGTRNINNRLLLHGEALQDSSIYNGTIVGTAVISTDRKKFGSSSIYFNGSTYLGIQEMSRFSFDNYLFTLDMWINFSTYSSSGRYCLAGKYAADPYSWVFEILNGRLNVEFRQASSSAIGAFATAAQTWNTNTWYHVCLQRVSLASGYDSFRVYINGVRIARDTSWSYNMSFAANQVLTYGFVSPGIEIGRMGSPGRFFPGYMDEIQLYMGNYLYNIDGFTVPTEPYQF